MKTLAIVNCRVSTDEQRESNSLNRQAQSVKAAAKKLDAEIPSDGWWSGSVSSKAGTNVTRKDLNEMLEYCKRHKAVKYAIFDEYDRYMRSVNEGPYFEVLFQQLGVKVWYASETDAFNGDDAMAKLMRTMSAFRAEGSNEERIKKSISGHIQALKEGRYTFPPKPGYTKGELPGVHVRHQVTFLPLQKAFKEVSEGLYTPLEALKRLMTTEFGKYYKKWDMTKFRQFAIDPYYAGIIEINRQVQHRNEHGLHEAMITTDEHERLKEVFLGRYKPRGAAKQYNPEFPMNKILVCEDCGCKLTGARKHNGFTRGGGKPRSQPNYYWKYRCRGCKKEFHRVEVHQAITEHFDKFEYNALQEKEFINALQAVWRHKQADKLNAVRSLQKRLLSLDEVKSNLVIEMSSASLEYKSDIRQELDKVKQQISNLKLKIEDKQALDDDLVDFIKFALSYGQELKQDWWDLNFEDRQRCQQLLFPGGITINSAKKVSTHEMSPIYRLATNKKDLRIDRKSLVVELPGITPGSVSLSL